MTFNEWFDKTYGPRPFPDEVDLQQLLNKTFELETELVAANMRYESLYHYSQARDYAQKAWDQSEKEHMNSGSDY